MICGACERARHYLPSPVARALRGLEYDLHARRMRKRAKKERAQALQALALQTDPEGSDPMPVHESNNLHPGVR